jgi:hypothetical protein
MKISGILGFMVMKMTIMAVWFVVAHSVVEFSSKMGAAGCSEVLGKFVPDSMASHHITSQKTVIM